VGGVSDSGCPCIVSMLSQHSISVASSLSCIFCPTKDIIGDKQPEPSNAASLQKPFRLVQRPLSSIRMNTTYSEYSKMLTICGLFLAELDLQKNPALPELVCRKLRYLPHIFFHLVALVGGTSQDPADIYPWCVMVAGVSVSVFFCYQICLWEPCPRLGRRKQWNRRMERKL